MALFSLRTCDFEVATLARQKLHRVAAAKIACVNGPLHSLVAGRKTTNTSANESKV